MYLEYVPFFAVRRGRDPGPGGRRRVAAVARDDIADVAVAALLDPQHEGSRLRGHAAARRSRWPRPAEILTRHTGREVRYVEETIEEARRLTRGRSGAPDWEIEGWVTTYTAIAAGELDVVSDTVARVAGHEPMNARASCWRPSPRRGRICGPRSERQRRLGRGGFQRAFLDTQPSGRPSCRETRRDTAPQMTRKLLPALSVEKWRLAADARLHPLPSRS